MNKNYYFNVPLKKSCKLGNPQNVKFLKKITSLMKNLPQKFAILFAISACQSTILTTPKELFIYRDPFDIIRTGVPKNDSPYCAPARCAVVQCVVNKEWPYSSKHFRQRSLDKTPTVSLKSRIGIYPLKILLHKNRLNE